MKLLPDLERAVPPLKRVEQTASTSPSQPPDALERITPKIETSATPPAALAITIARQLVLAVALSSLSISPQWAEPSIRRRLEAVAAETSPAEIDPVLVKQIRQMFERGASEFFQDGMESNFARELILSVREYGDAAIMAIAEYLFSSTANPEVGSEALRRIADVADPHSLASRWGLLERGLKHRSSRVRDGAILGFAALDDPHTLEILKDAKSQEPVPELQRLIQKVIEQLGATNGETATQS